MANKSTAHTSWAVPTGEPLKSADTIELSNTCKANTIPLASMTSRDDHTPAGPRYLLRSQQNISEGGLDGETRLAMPQVTNTSGRTTSPLSPTSSLYYQQNTCRVQVDAKTQTIHSLFSESHIIKVSDDEAIPSAPESRPQSQHSGCQTEPSAGTSQAKPKASQTSNDATTTLSTSYTFQSLPKISQSRANAGTIQVDEATADPSSVTPASPGIILCLHLAIMEMILPLILLFLGSIITLMYIPLNGAEMNGSKTACASPDDGSASQAIPVGSKAAKKSRKKALRKALREQTLREARVALELHMTVDKLPQKGPTVDEPQAASVNTSSTSSNFSALTTTKSGINLASYGLPSCKKKKDKNKGKKTPGVAIITAEVAQVTISTQPTSEHAHSCLGPLEPSTLRKAYWVD